MFSYRNAAGVLLLMNAGSENTGRFLKNELTFKEGMIE